MTSGVDNFSQLGGGSFTPFEKCLSCEAMAGLYVITAGHAKYSWESGGVIRLPVVQGRVLMGVQGAKPTEALQILYFTFPKTIKNPLFIRHFFLCISSQSQRKNYQKSNGA